MLKTKQVQKVFRKDKYFEAIGYEPHEAQREVHWDVTRNRALCNGRRWGKTLLGAREGEATAWVTNWLGKPQHGWIIGPQYVDSEKEFRFLHDSLRALGVDKLSLKFLNNPDNGNMHIKTKWGWEVECRSAAHPETLVGEGLDWVIMVEAGRLRRSTFTQYVRPALSDKRGWALMTGVPEMATDISLLYWGWKRGQDANRLTWNSWRKPSWTNTIVFPGGRNDPEILEAEEDLTEDEFRRQYGAEFVDRVGRVMAEWDDEIHLRNLDFDPDLPLYAAVDFGYTNPFVWLWIQVDAFNNVYVLGEHYITRQDTGEICDRTLIPHPWTKHLTAIYVDPHEPDDAQVLQKKLRKPTRNNTGGDIRTRNRMIRERLQPLPKHAPPELQQAAILFDINRCPRLAWEMREGYRWPEHKNEMTNETENPMDKDNHGPEALSRFIFGFFSVVGGERRTRVVTANTHH